MTYSIYRLQIKGAPNAINPYYGSTKQELKNRLSQHKSYYKKYKETKQLCYTSSLIYEYADINNLDVEIVLIEEVKCCDLLMVREGWYLKLFPNSNKVRIGRTNKEYYQDMRNTILQKKKAYYNDNKQAKALYYKKNRDHILNRQKNAYKNKKILLQFQ